MTISASPSSAILTGIRYPENKESLLKREAPVFGDILLYLKMGTLK